MIGPKDEERRRIKRGVVCGSKMAILRPSRPRLAPPWPARKWPRDARLIRPRAGVLLRVSHG